MLFQGQTGPQVNNDGANPPARVDKTGCLVVSECHGRFFEQTYRGNMFSIGCALTALSAATILLTASAQPIVGVWNPATSPVNLVLLQAELQDQMNTLTTPASPGAFILAGSIGNNALLTAGLAPFNRKSMVANGSQAKAFALSTASLLTGLTNNLTFIEPLDVPIADEVGGTLTRASSVWPSVVGVHNFDGSFIVPPGGVLAIVNTVSTTTHSVAARLMWEEVAI